MFRITRKADYAVFILSYLARRADEEGRDALVSAQELASFSALNKSLVANLLKDLTRAGFLGSVRGARGGYRLARAAREISLAEILRSVEGPFTFVECAGERIGVTDPVVDELDHDNCNLNGLCQSKSPLLVLHFRIQQMLEELKLAELAGLETTHGLPTVADALLKLRNGGSGTATGAVQATRTEQTTGSGPAAPAEGELPSVNHTPTSSDIRS